MLIGGSDSSFSSMAFSSSVETAAVVAILKDLASFTGSSNCTHIAHPSFIEDGLSLGIVDMTAPWIASKNSTNLSIFKLASFETFCRKMISVGTT